MEKKIKIQWYAIEFKYRNTDEQNKRLGESDPENIRDKQHSSCINEKTDLGKKYINKYKYIFLMVKSTNS